MKRLIGSIGAVVTLLLGFTAGTAQAATYNYKSSWCSAIDLGTQRMLTLSSWNSGTYGTKTTHYAIRDYYWNRNDFPDVYFNSLGVYRSGILTKSVPSHYNSLGDYFRDVYPYQTFLWNGKWRAERHFAPDSNAWCQEGPSRYL